jgi:hypothetical protein
VIRRYHSWTCVYLQNAHLTGDLIAPLQSNQMVTEYSCGSLGVEACYRRFSAWVDGASRPGCGDQPSEGFQAIPYHLMLVNVHLGQYGGKMIVNWMDR